MRARARAIIASLAAVLFFTILFASHGYRSTWDLWNIPTISPHFADLRVITHGADSHAQGFDPMVENPADPAQRRLNYPRLWQFLYPLGINQTHTTLLGLLIIFSFLVAICLILPDANNATLLLVFAAVLSPAALLGVERANIDLLMFFLTALALLAVQRSHLFSAAVLLSAFALKLFPLLGWAALLRIGKAKFVPLTVVALGMVGIYLFAIRADLALISEGTPRGTFLSYGLNVYWMALAETDPTRGAHAKVFACLLALLVLGLAVSALFLPDSPCEKPADALSLDAFRAGAAVYTGTFLLGNNWDYRLIFLIFTLPQLIHWTGRPGFLARLSRVTLTAILLSCWHMLIVKLLRPWPNGYSIGFNLDELANWAVFASLAYLLLWSAPVWIKEAARKLGPQAGPSA